MYYLNEMSKFCNPNYFTKLIKFITLFREHVNIFNSNKTNENNNDNQKDFNEINDSEDVQNSCNEFITEFFRSFYKKRRFLIFQGGIY